MQAQIRPQAACLKVHCLLMSNLHMMINSTQLHKLMACHLADLAWSCEQVVHVESCGCCPTSEYCDALLHDCLARQYISRVFRKEGGLHRVAVYLFSYELSKLMFCYKSNNVRNQC